MNELAIRSRHGLLRDLVPIYSVYQLLPNLVGLGLLLWLSDWLGHFPILGFVVVMLGWVFQFVSRPSVMKVSPAQAAWLEALLDEQGYYGQSEADGRWRTLEKQWWQRWPHQFIQFSPGDGVMVTAPRDVMESLRANIEVLQEQGELSFPEGPITYQPAEPERLPWHMHVPAVVLGAACVIAWVGHLFTGDGLDMLDWGVSGEALRHGRYETIFLHMFAHGGAMHLTMNTSALAAVGGPLTARLGPAPLNWLRFVLLFLLSGLAGAALYLALHPGGAVPMLGASGALYGLFGLLIRAPAADGAVLDIKSSRIRRIGWDLVKQNAFLFVLLALLAWSSGGAGGLAWEAHLGGFLFGLLAGPRFLPRAAARGQLAPSAAAVPTTCSSTD